MKAHNGVTVRHGQIWSNKTGVLRVYVVGTSKSRLPVVQGLWSEAGTFFELSPSACTAFLHEIKREDCNHPYIKMNGGMGSHCEDCLDILT